MSVITEVRFAHDRGALAYTLNELPETDVRLIRETSTEPEQKTYFLRFGSDRTEAIQTVLAEDHTVRSIESAPESDDQELWGVEFAEDTELLNPLVTSKGGFVLHARGATMASGSRGWHESWLLPDQGAIHPIWQRAREAGFEFEPLRFRQSDGTLSGQRLTGRLTEEQLTALTLAYEHGYFTEPRETDLEELAELLDLSPSAVAGRLKRGMKLLIEETFIGCRSGYHDP